MRKAFVKSLVESATREPGLVLLTADLGFMVLEDFGRRFPDRFYNVGVAEGNMVGAAAGMALCDKIVFTYSIGTFMTMRAYDHIRNDVASQNLNVKIVGVGGGFPYAVHGVTHHVLEDIAIMRVLPNMTVLCPADPVETELAVKESVRQQGPFYLRIGKGGDPLVHEIIPKFKIGSGIILKEGSDLTLIATGNQVYNCLQAAEQLGKDGYSSRVISMHTIKPLDSDLIVESAKKTGVLVTVEEHAISGGLSGAAAEVLLESGIQGVRFKRLGIRESTKLVVGDQQYLRDFHSLTPEKISAQVKSMLEA